MPYSRDSYRSAGLQLRPLSLNGDTLVMMQIKPLTIPVRALSRTDDSHYAVSIPKAAKSG
jgi:hypothetical protein